MTDEEIFAAMFDEPKMRDGLIAQIGEIKSQVVDHEHGMIHFFGTARNCSFRLPQVLAGLEQMRVSREAIKKVSFE